MFPSCLPTPADPRRTGCAARPRLVPPAPPADPDPPSATPAHGRGAARWRRARQAAGGVALLLAALALGALLPFGAAAAQSLVSIDRETVNMRAGAGTRHPVLWQLARGYPLRVLAHRGGWLQVEDFEGDRGWVLARLTGRKPHTVVKVDRANLRLTPSTRARVVGRVGYGEVLRTLERRPGWLRVRDGEGRTGWVARRLVWGW